MDSLSLIFMNQLFRQKPLVGVRYPILVKTENRSRFSSPRISSIVVEGPGKGEISRVTALHIQTESIGYRTQKLQRLVRLLQVGQYSWTRITSSAISQISQDHTLAILISRHRQSKIGKSEIGNLRHLTRFSLRNYVLLYILHEKILQCRFWD